MSRETNYYRTLRVAPSASEAQIKRAYRILAKQYHPDRVPPDRQERAREKMARINAAYEALSDPQKRARYDIQHGYAQADNHRPSPSPGSALWHTRRVRERSRRQQMERWRAAVIISAATLGIGLFTLLFVRTTQGYLISAFVNVSALGVLLIGLVMVNK